MRRSLVAGNWKMHGSRAENASLVRTLLDQARADATTEVMLCPPFVYLHEVGRLLKDSDVALGAQSLCAEAMGAFTGEVSAGMLKDVGCSYVLVGHSERRQIYAEGDALVARKFVAAQPQGLVPVLCVGETLEEREDGHTAQVVARQLDAVLAVCGRVAVRSGVTPFPGGVDNPPPTGADRREGFMVVPLGRELDRGRTCALGLAIARGHAGLGVGIPAGRMQSTLRTSGRHRGMAPPVIPPCSSYSIESNCAECPSEQSQMH